MATVVDFLMPQRRDRRAGHLQGLPGGGTLREKQNAFARTVLVGYDAKRPVTNPVLPYAHG